MTALIAVRKQEHEKVVQQTLVPVVYKKKRVVDTHVNKDSMLAFHTFKFFGGVLNPAAVHGHGHYVRKLIGNNGVAVQSQLKVIAAGLQA
jgi:hypothetical protein